MAEKKRKKGAKKTKKKTQKKKPALKKKTVRQEILRDDELVLQGLLEKKYTNRFNVQQKIDEGHGTRSSVYRVFDNNTKELIAVKIGWNNLREETNRFKRDHEILERAEGSKHIIERREPYFCITSERKGYPIIFLEYAEAGSLRRRIEETRRNQESFNESEAIDIIIYIASGLGELHNLREKGAYAHQDLKPSNILITKDGVIKLTDFETARPLGITTKTEEGTSYYIAPEQKGERQPKPVSDIYSLGLIFYELLTLDKFFDVEKEADIARSKRDDKKFIPQRLETITNKYFREVISNCIRPKPEKRYQSADEVKADLEVLKYQAELAAYESALAALNESIPTVESAQALINTRNGFYALLGAEDNPCPRAVQSKILSREAGIERRFGSRINQYLGLVQEMYDLHKEGKKIDYQKATALRNLFFELSQFGEITLDKKTGKITIPKDTLLYDK